MSEYIQRQMSLLSGFVNAYQDQGITLNALIQRIEGVTGAIDSERWSESVHQIILDLEQINAAVSNDNIQLSDKDKSIIEKSLKDLKLLVVRFAARNHGEES